MATSSKTLGRAQPLATTYTVLTSTIIDMTLSKVSNFYNGGQIEILHFFVGFNKRFVSEYEENDETHVSFR